MLHSDSMKVFDVIRLWRDGIGSLRILVEELTFAALNGLVTSILQVVALKAIKIKI